MRNIHFLVALFFTKLWHPLAKIFYTAHQNTPYRPPGLHSFFPHQMSTFNKQWQPSISFYSNNRIFSCTDRQMVNKIRSKEYSRTSGGGGKGGNIITRGVVVVFKTASYVVLFVLQVLTLHLEWDQLLCVVRIVHWPWLTFSPAKPYAPKIDPHMVMFTQEGYITVWCRTHLKLLLSSGLSGSSVSVRASNSTIEAKPLRLYAPPLTTAFSGVLTEMEQCGEWEWVCIHCFNKYKHILIAIKISAPFSLSYSKIDLGRFRIVDFISIWLIRLIDQKINFMPQD